MACPRLLYVSRTYSGACRLIVDSSKLLIAKRPSFDSPQGLKIGDVDDLADSRQKLMANLDFDSEIE